MASIRGISSMATRLVLAELAAMYERRSQNTVQIESVGGVDAARRVQEGEPFDVVFLASDAIEKLDAAGKIVAGSRLDIVRSGVAVAVKRGWPHPDVSSEEGVRRAVTEAATIGYSTGPSGTALMKLFERWGIADQVRPKLVQASPGIPVASLVAEGRAAIGFQQLSELLNVEGIDVVGLLPPAIQITTIFSGAVCAASPQPGAARELLRFMASPEASEAKRKQGMEDPS